MTTNGGSVPGGTDAESDTEGVSIDVISQADAHPPPTREEVRALVSRAPPDDEADRYVVRLTPVERYDRRDVLEDLGNGLRVLATSFRTDWTRTDGGDESFDLLVGCNVDPTTLRRGLESMRSVDAATVLEITVETATNGETAAGKDSEPVDGGRSTTESGDLGEPTADSFADLKATVEQVGTETLLAELEDVEFPGRTTDDEIDFDELLSMAGVSNHPEPTRDGPTESMTDSHGTQNDDEESADDDATGNGTEGVTEADDEDVSLDLPLDTDEESGTDADAGVEDPPEIDLDTDTDADASVEDPPEIDLDTDGDAEVDLAVDDPEESAATATGPDDPVVALVERLESGDVPADVRERLRDELGATAPTSLEAQVTHLQTRLSEFEAYRNALEEFLDEKGTARDLLTEVESELENLRERVDSLERTVEAERSERRDLAEAVDRLEDRLDERAPSDQVASLADAVESLESDFDQLSGDVAENAEWREQVASAFAESGVGDDPDRV